MKNERKKLLAKIAYLYYIEERSQSDIAAETGIYRTTISRMLAEAKKRGHCKDLRLKTLIPACSIWKTM